MVKKIPKKIISKKTLGKKSLKSYSYKPKNLLNKYIPKELRKFVVVKNLKEKPLSEAAIKRLENLKYTEKLINQIHSGMGVQGGESNLIKDALNLKPTNTKAGILRLEKIAKQLKDGNFSINKYLGKNPIFKELKGTYNFIMDKNNMVKLSEKSARQIEIEEYLKKYFPYSRKEIQNSPFFQEYNTLRNELNKIKRDFRKQNTNLKKDKKPDTFENIKSLADAFKFIFKSAKEREFYEQNKDFFRATGGGTKANRANPAYVKAVRNLKGEFLNDYNTRKYQEEIDDYNLNNNIKSYLNNESEKEI